LVQKPTKKSAKSLFFALFATVCENYNRVAEPAGTGKYFTEGLFNAIQRASLWFGAHTSISRPPATTKSLAAAKNS